MSLIKNVAPKAVPKSGDKNQVIDYIIRDYVSDRDRPYREVSYRGTVLYSSFLTEKTFREKYDLPFVDYVLGKEPVEPSPSGTVVESIVWIPEVCGCLPKPPPGDDVKFYKTLREITLSDTANRSHFMGFDQLAKNTANFEDAKKAELFLKMIKRYPKVYYFLDPHDHGLQSMPLNSKVSVKFPYDYDIYAGVLVGKIGK